MAEAGEGGALGSPLRPLPPHDAPPSAGAPPAALHRLPLPPSVILGPEAAGRSAASAAHPPAARRLPAGGRCRSAAGGRLPGGAGGPAGAGPALPAAAARPAAALRAGLPPATGGAVLLGGGRQPEPDPEGGGARLRLAPAGPPADGPAPRRRRPQRAPVRLPPRGASGRLAAPGRSRAGAQGHVHRRAPSPGAGARTAARDTPQTRRRHHVMAERVAICS